MQQLIDLCASTDWETTEDSTISKADCDLWIDFNTDRAVLGINSKSAKGILNDSSVQIPDNLLALVNSYLK